MGAGHAHALYVHEHSPVHRMAPEAKIVAAFVFIAAVAVTPRQAIWAFALYMVAMGAVIRVARLRVRFVLVRLAAVTPFILFALLIPFIASGEQIEVVGVSLSREGLWGMWNIIAKAAIGATASLVLAATTEIPEMLRGLTVLRVPPTLTAIAMFMVRYLVLVSEEMERMRLAMTARGHDPRWLGQARPIASAAGALFIRSYERGERVHAGMLARGFTGRMPDLNGRRSTVAEWRRAALLPLTGIIVAVIALVVT